METSLPASTLAASATRSRNFREMPWEVPKTTTPRIIMTMVMTITMVVSASTYPGQTESSSLESAAITALSVCND